MPMSDEDIKELVRAFSKTSHDELEARFTTELEAKIRTETEAKFKNQTENLKKEIEKELKGKMLDDIGKHFDALIQQGKLDPRLKDMMQNAIKSQMNAHSAEINSTIKSETSRVCSDTEISRIMLTEISKLVAAPASKGPVTIEELQKVLSSMNIKSTATHADTAASVPGGAACINPERVNSIDDATFLGAKYNTAAHNVSSSQAGGGDGSDPSPQGDAHGALGAAGIASQANGGNNVRSGLKWPIFDGTNYSSFIFWESAFRTYVNIHKVPAKQQAAAALLCIHGKAREDVDHLAHLPFAEETTVESFLKELKGVFVPESARTIAQIEYDRTYQRSDETIREYANKLRNNFFLAQPDIKHNTSRMLITKFVDNLHSDRIRTNVRRKNCTTYTDAVATAIFEGNLIVIEDKQSGRKTAKYLLGNKNFGGKINQIDGEDSLHYAEDEEISAIKKKQWCRFHEVNTHDDATCRAQITEQKEKKPTKTTRNRASKTPQKKKNKRDPKKSSRFKAKGSRKKSSKAKRSSKGRRKVGALDSDPSESESTDESTESSAEEDESNDESIHGLGDVEGLFIGSICEMKGDPKSGPSDDDTLDITDKEDIKFPEAGEDEPRGRKRNESRSSTSSGSSSSSGSDSSSSSSRSSSLSGSTSSSEDGEPQIASIGLKDVNRPKTRSKSAGAPVIVNSDLSYKAKKRRKKEEDDDKEPTTSTDPATVLKNGDGEEKLTLEEGEISLTTATADTADSSTSHPAPKAHDAEADEVSPPQENVDKRSNWADETESRAPSHERKSRRTSPSPSDTHGQGQRGEKRERRRGRRGRRRPSPRDDLRRRRTRSPDRRRPRSESGEDSRSRPRGDNKRQTARPDSHRQRSHRMEAVTTRGGNAISPNRFVTGRGESPHRGQKRNRTGPFTVQQVKAVYRQTTRNLKRFMDEATMSAKSQILYHSQNSDSDSEDEPCLQTTRSGPPKEDLRNKIRGYSMDPTVAKFQQDQTWNSRCGSNPNNCLEPAGVLAVHDLRAHVKHLIKSLGEQYGKGVADYGAAQFSFSSLNEGEGEEVEIIEEQITVPAHDPQLAANRGTCHSEPTDSTSLQLNRGTQPKTRKNVIKTAMLHCSQDEWDSAIKYLIDYPVTDLHANHDCFDCGMDDRDLIKWAKLSKEERIYCAQRVFDGLRIRTPDDLVGRKTPRSVQSFEKNKDRLKARIKSSLRRAHRGSILLTFEQRKRDKDVLARHH